jgi:photosystem II stability/assembly factor-like uncharacterized protein
MKNTIKHIVLLLLALNITLVSCEKETDSDDDDNPTIENGECMNYLSVHDMVRDARDIFFINDQEGWMIGFNGSSTSNTKLLHTTDGRQTWDIINSDLGFGAMMHVNGSHFKMHFTDSNNGYIAIDFGMGEEYTELMYYYTTDKGATWSAVPLPTVGADDNIYLYGMGVNSTQMVFAAFIATPESEIPDCYKLFFVSNTTHTISSEVILECSTVGDFSFSYNPRDIHFADSGIINMRVYDSDTGTLYMAHSEDFGVSWSHTAIDYTPALHSYMQFVNDQVGFMAANTGIFDDTQPFYKTTDGGATWILKTIDAGAGSPIYRLSFADENNGLAIRYSDNELFKTTNGGDTWSRVGCFLEENTGLDIATYPQDIYYASPDNAIILTKWFNVDAENDADMNQNRVYFYTGE